MGRWRPPGKGSSPYITPDGAAALRAELDRLWRKERPEVVRALAAAAAEGDRSENAEYTYRKKQLGAIDRRVRYLRRRLDEIRIVDQTPADETRIRFGAWVTLEDQAGRDAIYRVVGADEIDAKKGWISVDSPMARALLGKAVDQRVTVRLPERETVVKILAIRYRA